MWENIIFLTAGAVLVFIPNLLLAIHAQKSKRKAVFLAKRETAYLEYIDALLELKSNYRAELESGDFFTKRRQVEAKLRLYGSQRAKSNFNELQKWIDEAFEIQYENGIIEEIDNIIKQIREELRID